MFGKGRKQKLTDVLVVSLAGIVRAVVDNVSRKEGKSSVRKFLLDILIHALLQRHGRVTFVITKGASWVRSVVEGIGCGGPAKSRVSSVLAIMYCLQCASFIIHCVDS